MKKEKKEFEKKMENIAKPDISSEDQKKHLKIVLLNSKRSAQAGIILILLPFIFAFANISKYGLGVDLAFITYFVEWLMSLDKVPVVNWLIRLLLLGGPVVALIANLLAIAHFYTDRQTNEFVISIKLKWLNIIVAIFCGFILFIFAFYLITENLIEIIK